MIVRNLQGQITTNWNSFKSWQSNFIFEYIHNYVLRKDDLIYYIGSTTNLEQRLKQHRTRKTGDYVRNYKKLELVETYILPNLTFHEAEVYESFLTIKYAKKYGYQNVNGGCFMRFEDGTNTAFKNGFFYCNHKKYETNDTSYINKLPIFKVDEKYNFVIKNNSLQLKLDL